MNKKSKDTLDLVTGPIYKTLILFAIPLVGSFLLQSLYSLVDMIIISRFAGTFSVAGVNIAAQISDLVLACILGFLAGPTIIVAQRSLCICFVCQYLLWYIHLKNGSGLSNQHGNYYDLLPDTIF